jgi:hypothetical protein
VSFILAEFLHIIDKISRLKKNIKIEIPSTTYNGGILNLYHAQRHSGSYAAPRPPEHKKLRVGTVHRGRQWMFTLFLVLFNEVLCEDFL